MTHQYDNEQTYLEHFNALSEDLSPWIPREKEVEKLLDGAAIGAAELDIEIDEVHSGLTLQDAETLEEVAQIAQPVQTDYDVDESVENYKKRTQVAFEKVTSKGSPSDILEVSSKLLNVDKSNITVNQLPGQPKFEIEAPLNAIKAEFGTTEQTIDILLNSTASSYGIDVYGIGSFEYITPEERENSNYNSSNGYATVDSDGNITSGGTYSGYYNG